MQNAIVLHLRVMFHNGNALSEPYTEMNGLSNPSSSPILRRQQLASWAGRNMRLLTFCYKSVVSSALTGGWTIPVNSSIRSTHM